MEGEMLVLYWFFLIGISGVASFLFRPKEARPFVHILTFVLILAFVVVAISIIAHHSISIDSIRQVIFPQ